MRFNLKFGAPLATAAALAIAVPAAAQDNHSSKSHKCTAHNAAYVEVGLVDSTTTLAQNPDGTWSGTLVVDVNKTNHRARADKSSTVSYTFSDAKLRVQFDGGSSGFAAGERVKLVGKLAVVGKKCTPLNPAATPTFRAIVVHPVAS